MIFVRLKDDKGSICSLCMTTSLPHLILNLVTKNRLPESWRLSLVWFIIWLLVCSYRLSLKLSQPVVLQAPDHPKNKLPLTEVRLNYPHCTAVIPHFRPSVNPSHAVTPHFHPSVNPSCGLEMNKENLDLRRPGKPRLLPFTSNSWEIILGDK